jgi:hypothetical protein
MNATRKSLEPGYEINPKTGRKIKACPPGKERGPKGNCVTIKKSKNKTSPERKKSPKKTKKIISPGSIKPGYEINPLTGRQIKACPPGTERGPKGNCVTIKKSKNKTSPERKKSPKTTKKIISPGSIKPGYEINPLTGRQIKACPPGTERGPKGNCIKIKKQKSTPKRKTLTPKRKTPTPKRKTPTSTSKTTPKRKTPTPKRKTPTSTSKKRTPKSTPKTKTPSPKSTPPKKTPKRRNPSSLKPGYEINPKTGRQIKACPPGKERGPKGNCINIKKSKKKTPSKTPVEIKTPPTSPQKIKIKCSKCEKMISKIKLLKHQESNKCVNNNFNNLIKDSLNEDDKEKDEEDEEKDEDDEEKDEDDEEKDEEDEEKDEEDEEKDEEDEEKDEEDEEKDEENKDEDEDEENKDEDDEEILINEKNSFEEGDEINEAEELNNIDDIDEKLFEINNTNIKNQNIIKNSIFRHLGLI